MIRLLSGSSRAAGIFRTAKFVLGVAVLVGCIGLAGDASAAGPSVTIDLGGGAFTNANGDITFDLSMGTNGPAGDSFTIDGASGADDIVFGANGVDLTNDGSVDVTTAAARARAGGENAVAARGSSWFSTKRTSLRW